MHIERHGHVRPLPGGKKARCGGTAICEICQKEQRHDAAVTVACELTRPYTAMHQATISTGAVQELLVEAYMRGAQHVVT